LAQGCIFIKPTAMKPGEKTKAMKEQKFQVWASEINKDWDPSYKAVADESALVVSYNAEEVARIDYNNGRYTLTGTDNHAVEQLEYMVNR
jgi:hypothetical protein